MSENSATIRKYEETSISLFKMTFVWLSVALVSALVTVPLGVWVVSLIPVFIAFASFFSSVFFMPEGSRFAIAYYGGLDVEVKIEPEVSYVSAKRTSKNWDY